MSDATTLRDEINKRLTLNWLIQGASMHMGLTLHHLMRDELNSINPRLLHLYDQFTLVNLLQWWHFDAAILVGYPRRFWRRAQSDPSHPFYGHSLLSRHGGMLAEADRRRAVERSKQKRLARLPGAFSIQALALLARLYWLERSHQTELVELAKQAAAKAWDIPITRLDATLTRQHNVGFGNLTIPQTFRGRVLRLAAVSYGGVMPSDGGLTVVARATIFPLLAKELVKGTAELICLHGLNTLSEEMYRSVIAATDRIEYEPWMLQSGGELWRRLLAVMPENRTTAQTLMHLARLPARSLESLMLAVIEQPGWARELVARLGQRGPPEEGA